jgi:hypothetical protein
VPARQAVQTAIPEIARRLQEHGISGPASEGFIRPLLDAARDEAFEHGHHDTWVIFQSREEQQILRVPGTLAAGLWVESRPFLLPVLPELALPQAFAVLAITRKQVRLIQNGEEVPLPVNVPAFLDEGRLRNAGEHAANRSGSVHFGVISTADQAYRHYRDWYAAVGKALDALFRQQPVILAGTREALVDFRAAVPAAGAHETLELSPAGGFGPLELTQRAAAILRREIPPAEKRAAERIAAREDSATVRTDVRAVLRSASIGRVSHLFLQAGVSEPGDSDAITGTRNLPGEFRGDNDDLYNAAAVETLSHGGEVFAVPEARLPLQSAIAALLRY